jgi:nucleotide-binding universal stress UspA family protein
VTVGTVIVAIDGSEMALHAAQEGLAVLQPGHVVIATVMEPADPSLVMGTGFAGGVMTDQEYRELEGALTEGADAHLSAAADALRLTDAELLVVSGEPGEALLELARDRKASAIVIGSRGRSGIKRALLGSVSDYVIRNAPCPVVVTRPPDD